MFCKGSQVQGSPFRFVLGATSVLYTLNLQTDVFSRFGFLSRQRFGFDVNPEPLNIEPLNGYNVLVLH